MKGWRSILLLEPSQKALGAAVRPALSRALDALTHPGLVGAKRGLPLSLPSLCMCPRSAARKHLVVYSSWMVKAPYFTTRYALFSIPSLLSATCVAGLSTYMIAGTSLMNSMLPSCTRTFSHMQPFQARLNTCCTRFYRVHGTQPAARNLKCTVHNMVLFLVLPWPTFFLSSLTPSLLMPIRMRFAQKVCYVTCQKRR